MEQAESSYQVKLEAFTGPLDLLLHLIRKHEVNIYDIPIALITQQYLEYLQLMKELNLSLAGEFVVMASTLVHIKSRMLLPQDEKAQEGEDDGDDPRSELVRRLVEYQQFKEVADRLSEQEKLWRQIFQREPESLEPVREVLVDEVNMFDLLGALQEVLIRTESQTFLDITPDTVTVQDRINAIIEQLEETKTIIFSSLFVEITNRLAVIVTFLALLELVRMKLVRVYQDISLGPVYITRIFLAGSGEEDLVSHDHLIDSNSTNNGGVHGNGYP